MRTQCCTALCSIRVYARTSLRYSCSVSADADKTSLHNAAAVVHCINKAMLACLSGLGAFEYFQLAEELNAEPVWVINNGISHTYSVPADQIWPLVQVLVAIPSSSIYQLASKHVEMCFIIYPWAAALLSSVVNLPDTCAFGAPPHALVHVLRAPPTALCYSSSCPWVARDFLTNTCRAACKCVTWQRQSQQLPVVTVRNELQLLSNATDRLSAYFMSCVVYINCLCWIYNF